MSEKIQADELPIANNKTGEAFPELTINECPNCGEVLTGRFCMACGQKDFNMLRPFWTLLEDTLGDLFSFDSRFFGTLIPLFFRPGYITHEYNQGKRAKFVPPFRQYLVISLIFFVLLVNFDIQLFNTDNIKFDRNGNITVSNNSQQRSQAQILAKENDNPIEARSFEEILDKAKENIEKNHTDGTKNSSETEKELFDSTANFLGGIKKIWQDPRLLNVILADWIPKMMFLMLPLFAVILKFVYIRRKKYYIEHLVFSMHYHAFLFLLFTFMMLLYQFMPMSHAFLPYLFWYIPIYLVIAMWTVYRQGPIKSFFKGLILSFTYFIFISSGLVIAIGYGVSKV